MFVCVVIATRRQEPPSFVADPNQVDSLLMSKASPHFVCSTGLIHAKTFLFLSKDASYNLQIILSDKLQNSDWL